MQHDFILLDRSGSMQSLWVEALSSINAYVHKLAQDKVETAVTLAVFDSQSKGLEFDILRDTIVPSVWKDVTDADATPRGMTPLNDATGRIVSMAESRNPDKAAIIIMTDGAENSSRELSTTQAKAALDRCRAKNWQVIFLGANFDNAEQSRSLGGLSGQTIRASGRNLGATMVASASLRANYGITGQSIQYSDDLKAEMSKD